MSLIGHPFSNEHASDTLGHIEYGCRDTDPDTGRPQHIRRAYISAAEPVQITSSPSPREEERKRNRTNQVGDDGSEHEHSAHSSELGLARRNIDEQ